MSNHDQRTMYGGENEARAAQQAPAPEHIVQKPRQMPGPEKPDRRKTIAIIAAVCLIAAIGIGAVLFFTGSNRRAKTSSESKSDAQTVNGSAAAEKEDAPAYLSDYDPEGALARAHDATRVKLNGVTYVLPCPVQTFLDNGWEIDAEAMEGMDNVVEPIAAEDGEGSRGTSLYLTDSEYKNHMYCRVMNADSERRYLENCYISRIEVEPDCADVELFGGVAFGTKLEDVQRAAEKLPTAAWAETNGDLDSFSYCDFVDARGARCSRVDFYCDYDFGFDRVSVESTDWFWTDGVLPSEPEVSAYTAPTELGDDFKSGVVEVGGELYRLPCPLTAFLDNGWGSYYSDGYPSLDIFIRDTYQREDTDALFGQKMFYLTRSDSDCWLEVQVANLANHPMRAQDCIVVEIQARIFDNGTQNDNVVLPDGIRIGQPTNAVTPTYNSSDSTMRYEWETDHQRVEIWIRKDSGIVSQFIVSNDDWTHGYT